ncbi:hypothetical protein PtrSN001C_001324 [Pyrenophora tritici-repentis]|uniref:Uncharacterized protein n=1 Tax=Pyrenophora tritici-repentis (strain Pt-1C-BFP) TaxID=426418 RepID=B2WJ74_PYRTR|nr:uncharacterized protein PTRG_10033 [Pyrenophora tritici-repentis Pt-1C-BFP]EDU43084.1 predicted protein [Pyrenophora tritici-repentis Pt-1C-BFP]KAI1551049.1 hypothetical protein PtrSN001C_001324 [Pyrenophora tritici-repentis]KAI1685353.1 hypothetical protein KJE20_05637 [Pyrenophora tritici-repentis]
MSGPYVTAEEFYAHAILQSHIRTLFRAPEYPVIHLGSRLDENNVTRYWAAVKSSQKRRSGKFQSLTSIYTGISRGYVLQALLEEVERKMGDQLEDDPDMPEIEEVTKAMGDEEGESNEVTSLSLSILSSPEDSEEDDEKDKEYSTPKKANQSQKKAAADKPQANKPPMNPRVIPGTARKEPAKDLVQTKEPMENPSEPKEKGKAKPAEETLKKLEETLTKLEEILKMTEETSLKAKKTVAREKEMSIKAKKTLTRSKMTVAKTKETVVAGLAIKV